MSELAQFAKLCNVDNLTLTLKDDMNIQELTELLTNISSFKKIKYKGESITIYTSDNSHTKEFDEFLQTMYKKALNDVRDILR
jgi:hypothetical protein